MISFIRFHLFSEHKSEYRKIALEHQSNAVHVYRLAHGKK